MAARRSKCQTIEARHCDCGHQHAATERTGHHAPDSAARSPGQVIVLTISDSDHVIREALNAGARGFLLKSDAPGSGIGGRGLQHNRLFFTPRVNDLVLTGFLDKGRSASRNEPPDCRP